MKVLLLALVALFVSVPATAQDSGARAAVEAAMADSGEGWNRGDVDRFLALYSSDPATTFTTVEGVARGTSELRERYLKVYPGQFGTASPATTLSFEMLDFRMLGVDHALLIARWTLTTKADSSVETGLTSLVFRKEAGGWKIIADHSS